MAEQVRSPYLLPDSLRIDEALRRFKADRQQVALVVDEHGAVDGIVTLEDLVEELVGEIYDESDRDVASAVPEPDGSLLLPGTFPVHDLPDLSVEFEPHLDYTTIAGLVISRLGQLPAEPGEWVTVNGWTIEVTGSTAAQSPTYASFPPDRSTAKTGAGLWPANGPPAERVPPPRQRAAAGD